MHGSWLIPNLHIDREVPWGVAYRISDVMKVVYRILKWCNVKGLHARSVTHSKMACVSISSQFKGAILKNQSSLTQDHKNVKPVHGLSFRPKATLHTVWYIAMLFSWRCPFNAFLYKSCTSPPYNNSLSSLSIDLFNSIFFSFIYLFFFYLPKYWFLSQYATCYILTQLLKNQ